MPPSLKYLAYGSNLHPERLRDRGVSVELIAKVALPGRKLIFQKIGMDGSAKCDIMESSSGNSVVWCALYAIEVAGIAKLDGFEGLGSGYERRLLELEDHGSAFAYVASPEATSSTMLPFDWYREMVVAGALYHRFPDGYVEEIRAVQATEDPDPQRRARSEATLKKLANGC
jgi:hypothetical protein